MQLTDGGYFEYLGLYELVRRRVSTIIVADARLTSTLNLAIWTTPLKRSVTIFVFRSDLKLKTRYSASNFTAIAQITRMLRTTPPRDPFFEEKQFEVYRELGYRVADVMCVDIQSWRSLRNKSKRCQKGF